MMSYKPSKVGQ